MATICQHQSRAISLKGGIVMKKISVFATTALAIVVFAFAPGSATAQSYSGTWKVSWDVTFPNPPFDGIVYTYCMKLTDNGSIGFPHSGLATLNGSGVSNLSGVFQVINNEFVATFLEGTGNGELDTQLFVGPGHNGKIGAGFRRGIF
jgi:hypothetical protein